MMFLFLIVIVVVICMGFGSRRGHANGRFNDFRPVNHLTDEELEEELAKRKRVPNLEAEVAELRTQIEALKKSDKTDDKELDF